MSNQVAVKQASEVSTEVESWGTEGVDTKDILIPKLLMMQGLSQLVGDGKAVMGDIVDSLTGQIMGNARAAGGKPVAIIPLFGFKTWVEYTVREEKGQLKRDFHAIVPVTPANADLPYEETVNGQRIARDYVLNYYVLLADKLDEFPYLVSFRRTSLVAGKKLATHQMKCAMVKKPLAHLVWDLTGYKKENDDGIFYVFDVVQKEPTSPEAMKVAKQWYDTLKTAKVKVDHADLKPEAVAADDGVEV